MEKTTARTTQGLREALFEEFDKLRFGQTSPARANALSRSASEIIGTVRLEMDYYKMSTDLDVKAGKNLIGSVKL